MSSLIQASRILPFPFFLPLLRLHTVSMLTRSEGFGKNSRILLNFRHLNSSAKFTSCLPPTRLFFPGPAAKCARECILYIFHVRESVSTYLYPRRRPVISRTNRSRGTLPPRTPSKFPTCQQSVAKACSVGTKETSSLSLSLSPLPSLDLSSSFSLQRASDPNTSSSERRALIISKVL